MTNQHIIKSVVLDVATDSVKKSRLLQDELPSLWREEILPGLERICDDLDQPGRHLRIPVLEIDLGDMSLSGLEQRFAQSFLKQFQTRLKQAVETFEQIPEDPLIDFRNPKEPTSETSFPENPESDAFKHFIRTGLLPWWTATIAEFETLLENHPSHMIALARESRERPVQLQRLVYQANDRGIRKLLPRAVAGIEKLLQPLPQVIDDLIPTGFPDKQNFRLELWRPFFRALPEQMEEPETFYRRLQMHLAQTLHISLSEFPLGWQRLTGKASLTPMREDAGDSFSETLDFQQSRTARDHVDTNAITETTKTDLPLPIEIPEKGTEAPRIRTFDDSDEIFIANAGLVIFWPYLERFFGKLGLLEEDRFISSRAAQHAALTLQYLVKPVGRYPEHLMALNKILCGISPNASLPAVFEPAAGEVRLCNELLEVVHNHWNQPAIREPQHISKLFLQRDGVIRAGFGDRLLFVERKPYDHIRDGLPWAISLVNLPWMDAMLTVDW